MRTCQKAGAFTLIELLVVVSVIAVLAGLLLPALSSAKEKGRAIVCLNHLRQMQLAALLYAGDHDDWLPRNYATGDGGMSWEFPSWVGGWISYGDWRPRDSTNILLLVEPIYGRIGNYTKNPLIYKCPSDRSSIFIGNKKSDRVRSYSLNCFVGSNESEVGTGWRSFKKTTDFGNPPPSKTFTFIDEHEDSIDDGYFFVAPASGAWADLPASRHGGIGILAFADGHAEGKKWLDGRTRKPVTREKFYGAFSPSNPDLEWVQERTTGKIE